jgi:DNA-binding Lrp family transcriptional regulator
MADTTMVTAVILMNVEPARTVAVTEILSNMVEISEVYSVAGNYDLVAVVRVKENEALADLVAERIRAVDGITRTETLIAFRAYSRHDLGSMLSMD